MRGEFVVAAMLFVEVRQWKHVSMAVLPVIVYLILDLYR